MVRDEIHAALDNAVQDVVADAKPEDAGKVDQLNAHLATVHMCVDQLLDSAALDSAPAAPEVTP